MTEWVNATLYAVIAAVAIDGFVTHVTDAKHRWKALALMWFGVLFTLDAFSWYCIAVARAKDTDYGYGPTLHLIDVLCSALGFATVVHLRKCERRDTSRVIDPALRWALAFFVLYCAGVICYWGILVVGYGAAHPFCDLLISTWVPDIPESDRASALLSYAGSTIALYGCCAVIALWMALSRTRFLPARWTPTWGRTWPTLAALLAIPAASYALLGPTGPLLERRADWPDPWRRLLLGLIGVGAAATVLFIAGRWWLSRVTWKTKFLAGCATACSMMLILLVLAVLLVARGCAAQRIARVNASDRAQPSCRCACPVAELQSLATALSTPGDVGATVLAALEKDGVVHALASIRSRLPGLERSRTGDIVQAGAKDRSTSATIVKASLGCLQVAEENQGFVLSDSGWTPGAAGCLSRNLTMSMSGAEVRLRQLRHGSPALQHSSYSWRASGYSGSGTDTLLPIVDADGNVKAFLLYSTYRNDYEDSAAAQIKAVTGLRDGAIRLAQSIARSVVPWEARPAATGEPAPTAPRR